MNSMNGKSTDPKHLDISLSQGIKIDWSDGHVSNYTLDYLRNSCPCATCREEREVEKKTPNKFPMFKPAASLESAEPVGRYAVQLNWKDGHKTGIYSFSHLRELCPCPTCKPANDK
jgi:DUF971 family protein